jgi:predicted membrane channel-forming protein YqfA (hemolysin III family)
MGKILLYIMFLVSIVGNIYLLYSVYTWKSGTVLEQVAIVLFAISNLVILILSITWYFVFRIQKAKKKMGN